MCGIAGIAVFGAGLPPEASRLRSMCDSLIHRGPDDEGSEIADGVALGMRRLSIIDVAGGHQPLYNEDRSVRVVYNGEIYNFRELRADLASRGHTFHSGSDGEVIAHLWEEHGIGFAERLNGMYAIALHDRKARRVVLARDPFGIKPLFWQESKDHLVFGSEIKALLASGRIAPALDIDALAEFLAWEYVPGPRTLFRGIRKLGPGATLELDLETGRTEERAFWQLAPLSVNGKHAGIGDREWADRVDAAVRTAVHRQLVSDVPLGAFLSGGVDSSLLVASMDGARTFSIGFDDPSYDEVRWSRQVADHLGLRHRVEILKPRVIELFDTLMRFQEDPIGDFSIFPTHMVSKLAREEVTVVLSGDGGDELFGGYETYVAQSRARLWRKIPAFLREGVLAPAVRGLRPQPAKKGLVNKAKRFLEGVEHDDALGHCRWRLFAGEVVRAALFTPEALAQIATPPGAHIGRLQAEVADRSELDRALYVDLRSYLCDNILVKVDRASMACSLEARVPYLDPDVVDLAFRIPERLKVDGGRTKVLLKRVAARHVPHACVYRPKEGFSIPIKNWLGSEFRPLLEDLLSSDRIGAEGIFRAETVARLKAEHFEGRANHSHLLWSLLVFQDWRRRWGA